VRCTHCDTKRERAGFYCVVPLQKVEKERKKQAELEAGWLGRKGGLDISQTARNPEGEGDSLPPLGAGGRSASSSGLRHTVSATNVTAKRK
jgi:hypothetical protein